MSAIVGPTLNSDTVLSDLVNTAYKGKSKSPKPPRRSAQPSSPRPYGTPSERNGALSDVEGFPDDEVVGVRGTDRNRPRDPMAQAVPKVVDKVGEKVAEEFEIFLDQYVLPVVLDQDRRMLIGKGLLKMSCPRVLPPRAP